MLATTCPGCGTVFRVQTEQLRQRNGLVRCGVCHQVFNALEALQPVAEHDAELEPEDSSDAPGNESADAPASAATAAASTAPSRPPGPSATVQPEASAPSRADSATVARSAAPTPPDVASAAPFAAPVAAIAPPASIVPPAPVALPGEPVVPTTPVAPPTTPVAPPAAPVIPPIALPDDPPRLEISSEALVRSSGTGSGVGGARAPLPVRPSVHVDMHAEASRARAGARRRTKRSAAGPRTNPFAWWRSAGQRASPALAALVAVLAVAALLQAVLLARHSLAMRMPSARPALVALAGAFGLTVEPPRRLSQLALERFELRPDSAASELTLSAVLRNRGDTPAQWPAIELTLADSAGTVVVRRALLPDEYLAGTPNRVSTGIAPRAELPLRLTLEAPASQWTRPTANLFYP